MEELRLGITASPELVAGIAGLAKTGGIEASAPEPVAIEGALNAGLTFEEVKQGLELLMLAFKAGTAAVAFLKSVRDFLKERGGAQAVTVSSPMDGTPRGVLNAHSTDADILHLVGEPPR